MHSLRYCIVTLGLKADSSVLGL